MIPAQWWPHAKQALYQLSVSYAFPTQIWTIYNLVILSIQQNPWFFKLI